MLCSQCGMDLSEGLWKTCPKCDSALKPALRDEIHTIDIAHGGESLARALELIDRSVDYALLERFKGLKIIHGYGSRRDHTSVIRDEALPMLKKLARDNGWKLVQDSRTQGAHILYFNT